MTIQTRAFARAGLLGNPSDGYNGKTIALSLTHFQAEVILEPSEELVIVPATTDRNRFAGLEELVEQVNLFGYYGADRLIKAVIKIFSEYCTEQDITLERKNFTLRYGSTIPRQVGMAGSSALITATLRALMTYYEVEIPREIQPNLILAAEKDELGISAGLMDRVVQVYEGCVYMDLGQEHIEKQGHGLYEPLAPRFLPDLYVAYCPSLGKVSGQVLNEIRFLYDDGDDEVIITLQEIAELAEQGRAALIQGDHDRFFDLMNENFQQRARIMRIRPGDQALIDGARACGASAKFVGSGGSIIGMYKGEQMFQQLSQGLGKLGATVFKL